MSRALAIAVLVRRIWSMVSVFVAEIGISEVAMSTGGG
jgi:hypothetical protein